jgi:hypothetical protein
VALTWINGRPYYRRSVRRGCRVATQWLGSGPVAILLEALDRDRRAEAEARRAVAAASASVLDGAEAKVAGVHRAAVAEARRFLEAEGYHQHARGAWRKKRMNTPDRKKMIAIPLPTPGETFKGADLAAVSAVLDLITDESGDVRARFLEELRAFVAELEGPSPSAIERTLCQSAGLCWIELRLQQMKVELDDDRRLGRSLRRYLDTLKTLTTVRRLASNSPIVNIKAKRVDASGSLAAVLAPRFTLAPPERNELASLGRDSHAGADAGD